MNTKNIVSTGLSLALLLASPFASAKFFWEKEEKKVRSTYVSAAYGSFTSEGDDFDEDERYHEFGLGSKLSKHFGVDATYTDFGKLSGENAEAEFNGFAANIVGYFPVSDYADFYLKGGIFFAKLELKSGEFSESFKDELPTLGLGFNVKVSEPLTLFAEVSHYRISIDEDKLPENLSQSDFEANAMKIGMRFVF